MPKTRSTSRTHKSTRKPTKPSMSASLAPTPSSNASTSTSTLYFWRQSDLQTGWLSQWYECAFTDPSGTIYPTAEHYMMYHKALLFSDPATGSLILSTTSPASVRTLGRQIQNFDESTWIANRERIVEEGTRYKFTRVVSEEGLRKGTNLDAELIGEGGLRGLLVATGERELVEASPMDKIWGIGFGAARAEKERGRWGLNLLGKVLVRVREELKRELDDKMASKETEDGLEEAEGVR